MDELKRIAELLRPLWPGVVMVPDGDRYLYGQTGSVRIAVRIIPGIYRSEVWIGERRIDIQDWETPAEAAGILRRQAEVQQTSEVATALGLEVSDG